MRNLTKNQNRVLSRLASEAAQPAYDAHKKRLAVQFVAMVKAGSTEDDALDRLQRETLIAILALRRAVQL